MREKRVREAPARRVTFVGLASRSSWAREGEVLLPVLPWKTGRDFFFFFDSLHSPVSAQSNETQRGLAADASQSSFIYSCRSFLGCRCTFYRLTHCARSIVGGFFLSSGALSLTLKKKKRVFEKTVE